VIVNYPMGEELVVEERKNFEVSDAVNLVKLVGLLLLSQPFSILSFCSPFGASRVVCGRPSPLAWLWVTWLLS